MRMRNACGLAPVGQAMISTRIAGSSILSAGMWSRCSAVTLVRSVSQFLIQDGSSRWAVLGRAAISARAASTSQSSWLGGSVKPKEYTSRGDRRRDGRWPRDRHSGQTGPTPGRMTRLMMETMHILLLALRLVRWPWWQRSEADLIGGDDADEGGMVEACLHRTKWTARAVSGTETLAIGRITGPARRHPGDMH